MYKKSFLKDRQILLIFVSAKKKFLAELIKNIIINIFFIIVKTFEAKNE
jgi:hypothetical protein